MAARLELDPNTNPELAPHPYKGHILGEWKIGPLEQSPPAFVKNIIVENWGWFATIESWKPAYASCQLVEQLDLAEFSLDSDTNLHSNTSSLLIKVNFENKDPGGFFFNNSKKDLRKEIRNMPGIVGQPKNDLYDNPNIPLYPASLQNIYPLKRSRLECNNKLFLIASAAHRYKTLEAGKINEHNISFLYVFGDLESELNHELEYAQSRVDKLKNYFRV